MNNLNGNKSGMLTETEDDIILTGITERRAKKKQKGNQTVIKNNQSASNFLYLVPKKRYHKSQSKTPATLAVFLPCFYLPFLFLLPQIVRGSLHNCLQDILILASSHTNFTICLLDK